MLKPTTSRLSLSISAVAPVLGVSVGRWDDRASWRVDYATEPTKEQTDAVATAILAFDPSPEADAAYLAEMSKAEAKARIDSDPILSALFKANHERLAALEVKAGITSPTEEEAKAALLGKVDAAVIDVIPVNL